MAAFEDAEEDWYGEGEEYGEEGEEGEGEGDSGPDESEEIVRQLEQGLVYVRSQAVDRLSSQKSKWDDNALIAAFDEALSSHRSVGSQRPSEKRRTALPPSSSPKKRGSLLQQVKSSPRQGVDDETSDDDRLPPRPTSAILDEAEDHSVPMLGVWEDVDERHVHFDDGAHDATPYGDADAPYAPEAWSHDTGEEQYYQQADGWDYGYDQQEAYYQPPAATHYAQDFQNDASSYPPSASATPNYGAPYSAPSQASYAPPPPLVGLPEDEELASLLMAWYYSGYYTGRYQALRQRGYGR